MSVFVGVDGRWNPDLLLLRHLSGFSDGSRKLQQVQQQLLQVRPVSAQNVTVQDKRLKYCKGTVSLHLLTLEQAKQRYRLAEHWLAVL